MSIRSNKIGLSMNPATPTLEILRQPALAVEAPLQLSGAWFNELCLWLQCRIG